MEAEQAQAMAAGAVAMAMVEAEGGTMSLRVSVMSVQLYAVELYPGCVSVGFLPPKLRESLTQIIKTHPRSLRTGPNNARTTYSSTGFFFPPLGYDGRKPSALISGFCMGPSTAVGDGSALVRIQLGEKRG